jgi:hypothetical protein
MDGSEVRVMFPAGTGANRDGGLILLMAASGDGVAGRAGALNASADCGTSSARVGLPNAEASAC